jgi:uncharacterized protein with FMN-binding domain
VKTVKDLTTSERRLLLEDLKAGHITRSDIADGVYIETDEGNAFNSMIEAETKRANGETCQLLLVGNARKVLNTKLPVIAYQIARGVVAE